MAETNIQEITKYKYLGVILMIPHNTHILNIFLIRPASKFKTLESLKYKSD